ncbi:MAG: putative lipid II flippase FtsW [Actinobacteria bacterium HGW-Actinobacteria-7]|nr:MAG: putative lipid II flippase FtsW [Actinobacteria bacterium HGW-Actinobacteria-7]
MVSGPRRQYAGGVAARYLLLGTALLLLALGLVMVYSASSITASVKEGSDWFYLVRQALFAVGGWGIAMLVARIDYRVLKDRAWMIWSACIALLSVVLVIGLASHGAQRWIPLGIMNLQPSELAKVACVLLVAGLAVEWNRGRMDTRTFAIRAAIATLVPSAFIIKQPDMGTTVTLVAAVAVVLILAGMQLRWIFGALAIALPVAVLFVTRSDYRMERVVGFLDPWANASDKGYQSVQALLAFGSGGLDGVGLGLSRQKFFYLPEAYTDFILAIIGEETGLIGTLLVVAAFAMFAWAGFKIATGARDPYGRLVAGGVTGMISFQAVLNMAAVTGLMPVTGKPLPFLSYGGSSMLVTMIGVGLLLSVSEYGMLVPRAVRPRAKSKETRFESTDERRGNRRPRLSGIDGGRTTRRGA